MVSAVLDLHEEWSDRLWEAFDENAGTLESLIDTIPLHLEIAS